MIIRVPVIEPDVRQKLSFSLVSCSITRGNQVSWRGDYKVHLLAYLVVRLVNVGVMTGGHRSGVCGRYGAIGRCFTGFCLFKPRLHGRCQPEKNNDGRQIDNERTLGELTMSLTMLVRQCEG